MPQIWQEKEESSQNIPTGESLTAGDRSEKQTIPEGMLALKVYFPEGKEGYLVPVSMILPWTEGVAKAALQKLIAGPTPAQEMRFGLTPILPPTTKVLGVTLKDGRALVDLNSSFLDYDPGKEKLVLHSLIYTLLQFSTIDEIEILIEGSKPEIFPGGTLNEGVFGRKQMLNPEITEEVADIENSMLLTLYFCALLGGEHIFYVPLTRLVAEQHEIINVTINELLRGPRQGSGLFSDIPLQTELRGFTIEEETLIVDFSKEILDYKGGLSGKENVLHQVVLTLTEIPEVKRVQIAVEGEKQTPAYGRSFPDPLSHPLLVNPL